MSSPQLQDCLNLIKTNITAANAAITSAEMMTSSSSGETPLERFLTVMGRNARTILSILTSRDDRYLEALNGNRSLREDDAFSGIVDIQDHIYKLAQTCPPVPASDKAKADHKRRISAYLLEMC